MAEVNKVSGLVHLCLEKSSASSWHLTNVALGSRVWPRKPCTENLMEMCWLWSQM